MPLTSELDAVCSCEPVRTATDRLTELLTMSLGALRDASASPTPADVLNPLLDQVVDLVPGTSFASVTWLRPGSARAVTPAATAAQALEVDTVQYDTGEGPCLDAARRGELITAHGELELRWPAFGRRTVTETGVRSVVSHPLSDGTPLGSLNLYGERPDALGNASPAGVRALALLVGLVAVAADTRARALNLETALASSRRIGTAIGVLMATHRCTDEQAFTMLRETSQRLHKRVRDLAEDVVLTGTLPE